MSAASEAGPIPPGATVPSLSERELAGLRAVGREWDGRVAPREIWQRALPVDPDLELEFDEGASGRTRWVPIRARGQAGVHDIEAPLDALAEPSAPGRVAFRARRAILGPPISSTAVAEERMGRLMALPVLSSDALSSVAYGPEAMLAVLVLAGSSKLELSLPIAGAIAVLMIAVGLGYRQVIRAYPQGGGSFVVASENLGRLAGLMAGAGLILDYTLTVAVSIASGVAAVTSAIPGLSSATVPIGLGVIALLVAGNLRGVRSAGTLFAAPTYLFILALFGVIVTGLVRSATHGLHAQAPPHVTATQAASVLLVLRAFASGATALTGIEAISNSVPVFREPQARNARSTLGVMLVLLIVLFAGTVVLAHLDGVVPGGSETVLSRLAHRSFGGGVLYAIVQASTALVLLLAANTAFNGFPRLLFFMARDGYMPRQFLRMGDRLAFTYGILTLAVLAGVLFLAFGGNTASLIPLYAVGVFLAFALCQSGMVRHWHRHRGSGWRRALFTNAVGAVLSAVVLVITAATKFTEGAWVTVILIPIIVGLCRAVHRHYRCAREQLRPHLHDPPADVPRAGLEPLAALSAGQPEEDELDPVAFSNLMVVPLAAMDLAALRALAYAVSLRAPVLAVHVSPDEREAERFHGYWQAWGDHLPLQIVVSPYRATVAPLAHYVDALRLQAPGLTVSVVVPELVVRRIWHRPLHGRLGRRLAAILRSRRGIVITSVPFHLDC